MLVILRPPSGQLFHLDFGVTVDVVRSPREQLRWVLEDYAARRDDLWDVSPQQGVDELRVLLAERADASDQLRDVLLALRFYALASPVAHDVARCLAHPDLAVRVAALGALGSMAVFPTTRSLERFVAKPDPREWREAAGALAKFGTADAVAILQRRADVDPDCQPFVERAKERRAILEEKELNRLVVPVLKTEDYEDLCIFSPFCQPQLRTVLSLSDIPEILRWRAGRVLGVTRQREAGPAALAAFREPNISPNLRWLLAWLLGRVRHVPALPDLYAALGTADGAFELTLLESIGQMKRPGSLGILLNHVEQRPHTAPTVRRALWRISRPVQMEDQLWYQQHEEATWVYVVTSEGRVEAEAPGPLLEAELGSDSATHRLHAAFALGQLPVRQDRNDLLRLLAERDPDPQVREVALRCAAPRRSRTAVVHE